MFKKLFIFFIIMTALNMFACANTIETVNVSDDEYGENMYTPALPLLFSELKNNIIKAPVQIVGFNSSMIDVLNNIEEPENRLDEKYYYKIIAKRTPKFRNKIKNDIYKKFGEKSLILDMIKWRPSKENELIFYAMVKKNVEFFKNFEILNPMPFNSSKINVRYFGVKNNARHYKNNVVPLFYTNENDFAVLLKTKTNDEIILYRTNSNEPVDIVYDEMNFKIDNSKEDIFGGNDKLIVPFINIRQIMTYNELSGKKIKNTNFIIQKIIESVEFSLDNKGAKLKNEAAIILATSSLIPNQRLFYFDKPFVLFMREENKQNPYFMLRISDTRYLVK